MHSNQSVEAVTKKRNIEFIGLRYAGCDHRVRSFNKESAHQELQEFLASNPFDDTAK